MATTLKEHYVERRNRIKATQIEAKSSLSKATRELGTAQQDYDALVSQYAGIEKKIADKRKALASASMPADIESLAADLRALGARLRGKRNEILDAEQKLGSLKLVKDSADAQLTRLGSALVAAEAEVTAAEARADQHTEWKQAVSDGSLAALAAKAQAELDEITEEEDDGNGGGSGDGDGGDGNGGNGDGGDGGDGNGDDGGDGDEDGAEDTGEDEEKSLLEKAKARIETDIPALLRDRAKERGEAIDTELSALEALIEDIENELDDHRSSTEGASGLVAKRRRDFERAEEAFKDFVLQSAARYDQAQSLIKTVTSSTELTNPQKSRIQAVALKENDAVLAKEKTLNDKRAAALKLERSVELAIAKALIADSDANPEDNSQVKTLRGQLKTAKTAVETAESALAEEGKPNALDLWEAAVPDPIWANLLSYENVITLLTQIADGDPKGLATAMETAEKTLASALKAEDRGVRATESVDDRISLLDAKLELQRNAHHQRKLGAVRGDA